MSKFTLFTLFLSGLVVMIAAELLVDQYLKVTPHSNLQTNIFQTQEPGQTEVSDPKTQQTGSQQFHPADLSSVKIPDSNITFDLIQKAGFNQVSLQRAIFSGYLFERIQVSDSITMPVIVQNLLKNNSAGVASFYEFPAKSKALADEIYKLLKQRSQEQIGVIVNETNSFGDASFYDNFFEYPDNAFLVVKKGDSVYAATYVKELHPFVQKLFQLLP